MWAHPGKKLLFMGGEFGQRREWDHDGELEWWVTDRPEHGGVRQWMRQLNRVYREEPALYEIDFSHEGFEWIDANDAENSVFTFLRKPRTRGAATLLVACNFTPLPRQNYAIGVPVGGTWSELLNSDAREFGGAGWGNLGGAQAAPVPSHGRPYSITVTLPPLATLVFRSPTHG
jgi:1,4-alpha-glucan branching enzyme